MLFVERLVNLFGDRVEEYPGWWSPFACHSKITYSAENYMIDLLYCNVLTGILSGLYRIIQDKMAIVNL